MGQRVTDKPIKVGILGYAHYMRGNFVPHIRDNPQLEILGVFNRGEDRRQQAEDDGYFATSDLDELLALPGIEAVVIGTGNVAHKEQAIKAAKAGLHILCEKPMALHLEDVEAMVKAAAEAGVVTHVNHNMVYGQEFRLFRKLCQEHAGDILHLWKRHSRTFGLWSQGARHGAVANPEMSGGWTFHHLCHQLNAACVLIGSPAVKVYHLAQKSCPEAPSEEIVNCLITFENVATAALTDGLPIGDCDDMGVQGSQSDIRLVQGRITLTTPGGLNPEGRPGGLTWTTEEFEAVTSDKNLQTVCTLFAQAIRGGENELLSFEFIRDQYRILEALKKSAETGEAVTVR